MRKIIDSALSKGAESCEVYSLSSLQTSVSFETSRLKGVSNTEERGVALRLAHGGRIGFATTTRVGEIDRLVDDAIATSSAGGDATFAFAGAGDVGSVDVADDRVTGLTVEEMVARGQAAVDAVVSYEKKINVEAQTERDVQEISVLTSNGRESSFRRTLYQFYVGGRLIEGTNMLDAGAYYGGSALGADYDAIAAQVVSDFERARTNVDMRGGPTTVLFTPRAMADIMLTVHQAANGSLVERKISPLAGRLGETVFDERVTIRDDGLLAEGYGSAPFDDEGVAMQTTSLVESGVLKSYLTDLRTAVALDHPPTGNGLRFKRLFMSKDLGATPSPAVTNLTMAGGDAPHEELLAGIGDGLLIDSIMGILMANLAAGDFAGNVAYGLKIKDGKFIGRVKDTMVAGNVFRLLGEQLAAISSDVHRVGLLGGLGSHELPYVVAQDVSISAGS